MARAEPTASNVFPNSDVALALTISEHKIKIKDKSERTEQDVE